MIKSRHSSHDWKQARPVFLCQALMELADALHSSGIQAPPALFMVGYAEFGVTTAIQAVYKVLNIP